MKIVLLGANGRTGRQVLRRALDDGNTVTALVRAQDSLVDISHPNLNIHIGDVCDINVLNGIFPEHDLVISTLGPRMPTKIACSIYSESAIAIVAAMQACQINRLLLTSTALLFPSDKFLDRVLRFIARHNVKHASLMEEHICNSNFEWTIARMGFLNDNDSIDFRLAEGKLPDGRSSISRAAVAKFLLTESNKPCHVNKIVGLCG